jgi:hypothetical protein
MAKRARKPRVKKVELAAGEVVSIEVPKGHTPIVAPHSAERTVEVVPVKKKKKPWWETWLYGDDYT